MLYVFLLLCYLANCASIEYIEKYSVNLKDSSIQHYYDFPDLGTPGVPKTEVLKDAKQALSRYCSVDSIIGTSAISAGYLRNSETKSTMIQITHITIKNPEVCVFNTSFDSPSLYTKFSRWMFPDTAPIGTVRYTKLVISKETYYIVTKFTTDTDGVSIVFNSKGEFGLIEKRNGIEMTDIAGGIVEKLRYVKITF